MNALILLALLTQSDEKIEVVTTLNVYRHLAEKIGGDRVKASALVHPKRDPHYLSADPEMQKRAGKAKLFVETGRGLEPWANDVIQHSGNPKLLRVVASKKCSVEEVPEVLSKAWGDIHPEGNPHVWLDPDNFRTIAKNVCEGLAAVDPSGKATYEANLKKYLGEIDEAMFGKELVELEGGDVLWRKLRLGKLDGYLEEEKLSDKLGGWAKKARQLKGVKMISYHKTYAYFAKRFGFEIVAELEEKPGIAPPAKHLEDLLGLVKRESVKVILNDVFYPTSAADYVAGATGAKVLVVPIDVGGADGVDSYVGMIDYILDRMLTAVK